MKKSGFDKETGLYFDITTGRTYEPDRKCAICGATWKPLEVHHYLDQSKCERDKKSKTVYPSTWTQKFINENQQLFTVCRECHNAIHRKSKTPINGRIPRDYIYRNEEKPPVSTPKAFIVKRSK